MSNLGAPISDPVVDENRRAKKTWIFYFNQLSGGDDGVDWTPVATGLTGGPTLSGKYFTNSGFIDFWITVDPVTDSSSVLGSTYIDLPFDVTQATSVSAVYGSTVAFGIIDPSTNRLFPPTWTTVASTVTLTGRVFTK